MCMNKIVNNKIFDIDDSKLAEFYQEHGWVIVKGIFNSNEIKSLNLQRQNMVEKYSKDIGVTLEKYLSEINQWRDLWLHGGTFEDAIFNEKKIQSTVKKAMDWNGLQLLHDHIISKPITNNDKIPWHQDSMFWPVDRLGCSSWTALQDTCINSGCLEILDCSHKNGCAEPIDFMQEEKNDFDIGLKHIQLPVKTGETIILHSLTWHRSSPNIKINNRAAHISLWIPPYSRWRPDLVDWHPINEFVETQSGEYLRGDRNPIFGEVDDYSKPNRVIHAGTKNKTDDITMFDSSKRISKQLSRILMRDGDITALLSSERNKKAIISKTSEAGICKDENLLSEVLHKLWLSHAAYKKNKSRNVFNTAYAKWWQIAGKNWEKIHTKNNYE